MGRKTGTLSRFRVLLIFETVVLIYWLPVNRLKEYFQIFLSANERGMAQAAAEIKNAWSAGGRCKNK